MKPSAKDGSSSVTLLKLRDGNVELSLFVGRDSGLHVLRRPRGDRVCDANHKSNKCCGSRFLRLTDFQKLIGVNIIQSLMNTRWPDDFHLSFLRCSESKMKTLVACRSITAGGSRESRLPVHLHPGAKSIAIAARAAQRNRPASAVCRRGS